MAGLPGIFLRAKSHFVRAIPGKRICRPDDEKEMFFRARRSVFFIARSPIRRPERPAYPKREAFTDRPPIMPGIYPASPLPASSIPPLVLSASRSSPTGSASWIRGRDDETDTLSRGSFCTGSDGGAGSGAGIVCEQYGRPGGLFPPRRLPQPWLL